MKKDMISDFAKAYSCKEDEIQIDGILNDTLFRNSNIKVLWVLKETWVDKSWETLASDSAYESVGGSRTYQPIAYIMHSIFNGYLEWKSMDYISDNPIIFESIKKSAFINVKKVLGDTHSEYNDIYRFYEKSKDLLIQQIKSIQPDIIIGCRPHLYDLRNILGANFDIKQHGGLDWGVTKEGVAIIQAYHPEQKTIKREVYINELVHVIKLIMRNKTQ